MEVLRLSRLLALLIFLLPALVSASTVYSSAMLSEADSLVNIVPKQSKILASNYLTPKESLWLSRKKGLQLCLVMIQTRDLGHQAVQLMP